MGEKQFFERGLQPNSRNGEKFLGGGDQEETVSE